MSKNTKVESKLPEKLFENKKWLSVTEASMMFSISKSLLYKHKDYGIPCSSSSGQPGGKLLFNVDEMNQWMDERKIS